jgi:hypothetical protein
MLELPLCTFPTSSSVILLLLYPPEPLNSYCFLRFCVIAISPACLVLPFVSFAFLPPRRIFALLHPHSPFRPLLVISPFPFSASPPVSASPPLLGLMNTSLLVSSVLDFCPSGSCQGCAYGASASSGSAACPCPATAGAPSGAPSAVCAPCVPAAYFYPRCYSWSCNSLWP